MKSEKGIGKMVKVGTLLPKEYHDEVSKESLDIMVPENDFQGIQVEKTDFIHLWNKEKSQELVFDWMDEDEAPDKEIVLMHKTYVDGPGKATGTVTMYSKDGDIGYGRFLVD